MRGGLGRPFLLARALVAAFPRHVISWRGRGPWWRVRLAGPKYPGRAKRRSGARGPVSRVLFRRRYPTSQTVSAAAAIHLGGTLPRRSSSQPGSSGAKRPVPGGTRDPYSALLRVGFAMRALLPEPRCALTAPFQPCCRPELARVPVSGLLSVALSLGQCPKTPTGRALPATLASWSPDFPRSAFL